VYDRVSGFMETMHRRFTVRALDLRPSPDLAFLHVISHALWVVVCCAQMMSPNERSNVILVSHGLLHCTLLRDVCCEL
jgi:hypothetical protein